MEKIIEAKADQKKPQEKPIVFKVAGQGKYYGYKRLKNRDYSQDQENNTSLHQSF